MWHVRLAQATLVVGGLVAGRAVSAVADGTTGPFVVRLWLAEAAGAAAALAAWVGGARAPD